jgi:hypothetical protein
MFCLKIRSALLIYAGVGMVVINGKKLAKLHGALLMLALTACGGGETTSPTPVSTVPLAPEVSVSLSKNDALLTENVTLSWTSLRAIECEIPEQQVTKLPAVGFYALSFKNAGNYTLTVKCSGNGGTASQSVTLKMSKPAPTVEASISTAKAFVGEEVIVSWTSTNANYCEVNELGLTQLPTSSNQAITNKTGGRKKYTVACYGDGGKAETSLALTVPMPVYATSYENKNNILLDDPKTRHAIEIKNSVFEQGEIGFGQRTVVFADFSQNGTYDTAVVTKNFYKGVHTDGSNPLKWADSPAKVYFIQRNENGDWYDVSDKFFAEGESRYTCITTSFLNVADFNNDKKPDFYLTCTGYDYPIVSNNIKENELSDQFIGLSQPDGKYRIQKVNVHPIYGHQSAAADINEDGNIDIITTDTVGRHELLVLWGNGDGSFVPDNTVFPDDTRFTSIFNLTTVPLDGKLNVILSGYAEDSSPTYEPGHYGNRVLQFENGKFNYVNDLTQGVPLVSRTGLRYMMMFDAVYKDGFIYSVFISRDYEDEAYVKTDFTTGKSTILYERTSLNTGQGLSAGVLKITSDNRLVNQMTSCAKNIVPHDFFRPMCELSIALD